MSDNIVTLIYIGLSNIKTTSGDSVTTALNALRSSEEKAVRLSVCLSNTCIGTKRCTDLFLRT